MFLSLPSFIFYCGNVLLATAYTVVTLLSLQKGGVSGSLHQPMRQQMTAAVFFAAGAGLHIDIAVHTIARTAFFDHGGKIVWDFAIIVFIQMVAIVTSLGFVFIERARQKHETSS